VEYLHTSGGRPLNLPFDLPGGHLPVIVPRPKVSPRTLDDGTVNYEAHNIEFLNLQSDRGLFDIGFMLNVRQFAKQSAAEQFTILALQRRLTFSRKLTFPHLWETGEPVLVDSSDDKLVWATIPETVIITSEFSVLNIHDQCMALSEPEALRENIEKAVQGCPDANVEEVLNRLLSFTPPHRSDISSALKILPTLGIVREYIKIDRRRRRAVFNMRMVASTSSGILRGMIAAEDLLRRVRGSEVTFSDDLATVEPPVKRLKSTSTGKRKKITRAEYQSKYHAEREKLTKAEKLILDYESNGCLTSEQFNVLRRALDDPTVADKTREELGRIFASAHTDLATDIPTATATEKKHRA
jgi:hypothetical protein